MANLFRQSVQLVSSKRYLLLIPITLVASQATELNNRFYHQLPKETPNICHMEQFPVFQIKPNPCYISLVIKIRCNFTLPCTVQPVSKYIITMWSNHLTGLDTAPSPRHRPSFTTLLLHTNVNYFSLHPLPTSALNSLPTSTTITCNCTKSIATAFATITVSLPRGEGAEGAPIKLLGGSSTRFAIEWKWLVVGSRWHKSAR